MAPINLHDPSNKTNALEECRFLSSIFMEPVHFSLSTIKPINSTGYLMESQILMRRLFSICSHFFGVNSLAKNVSEKQHVFYLQTQNSIRTPTRACSVWPPHFDRIQPCGRSITCESDKDDNWGCGGRRQQSAVGGKQNWWAEMRRRQTGEQATNRH
jgi:hypothetical protein